MIMAKLLLLNGPNLNLLGSREPNTYGHASLHDVEQRCSAIAQTAGHQLICFQTNAEHELIDRIQAAPREQIRIAIINPGGLTHSSVSLRDAFKAVDLPFIEVHVSNIHAREPFRRHSYLSDIARGVITGLGVLGYELAIRAALEQIAA